MNIRKFKLLGAVVAMAFASCGNASKNDPNQIKVGVEAGPEYSLAEAAQKVAKEQYGLDVELVQFNDYVMPNEALRQKDIDVNVFQNKPYLDVQSKQRDYNFAIVGNTFVFPLAGYSKKIKRIEELQEGNTIIIPNDPTNGGRALLLMEKVGLIKLKEGVGLLPTVNDIVGNPKKLRILELEAPQLPRSLDDAQVTVAIINNTFAASIGLVAKRDGIFVEDEESPYVNIIVSRIDNQNDEKVKKFVKAYQSAEVEAVADNVFKGGAIKGW
ncbi:methionine ABC transporter substrate-binding lipoprotein MetQ [Olivibacter sp. XZL3]|uniref:methionine ABC transporter substrate-binding lipoprotein MetQ n=1 Tax=Olivibacter sp. XZL3 TaxID=1735116 RepID=UPI002729E921|nr:methionine ABC transporter substrate-binding lipoprotein MetQ [Olivibacter sp. XZL3]